MSTHHAIPPCWTAGAGRAAAIGGAAGPRRAFRPAPGESGNGTCARAAPGRGVRSTGTRGSCPGGVPARSRAFGRPGRIREGVGECRARTGRQRSARGKVLPGRT
ncbi:hypothetical protein PCLA_05f0310 [Pseudomonas citronellolis]|nr:hypothetical protein PCLA_05f0310 [Pseudomonas citronellolis]